MRWLRVSLRILGCNLEDLNIDEGAEIAIAAIRAPSSIICSLTDFYQGIFPPEEEEEKERPLEPGFKVNTKSKKFLGDNIQSAEQYKMLAKMGLATDKRKDNESNI